jgi:hypothetical protein
MNYYFIRDGVYSHVTTKKPNSENRHISIEIYKTFTKAKKALIQHLKTMDSFSYALMKEEHKDALKDARALKKSDLEEE